MSGRSGLAPRLDRLAATAGPRDSRPRHDVALPSSGMQGRFAAYAAHELRGPIALQRALVEVTLADPDADLAALRAMGERVVASCEQQQRLIDTLLTLARSQHGLTRREQVDLATVTADVLRSHAHPGLGIHAALEPAQTNGDPQLVERVVANLVTNAVRHNISGGSVGVATHTAHGRAVLSVTNTGPPISADDLTRIFQPFQQLGHSSDGVGLGLAIVQAIADAHDALVTAQTRPGGGLRVDIGFRTAAPQATSL